VAHSFEDPDAVGTTALCCERSVRLGGVLPVIRASGSSERATPDLLRINQASYCPPVDVEGASSSLAAFVGLLE